MIEPIKVILADDHDVYRDGLKLLLSRDPEIQVVGEAANGEDLISVAKKQTFDVLITDLVMPKVSGIEAIEKLYTSGVSKKNIALSTFDSEYLIVEALEAGAIGYIIKNAQRGEIIEAIKTVYEANPYYCKSTSTHLVKMISESKYNPYQKLKVEVFTEKEKEIIRLICQEKTSDEIGKILLLGKRNVEAIRVKILYKMNTKTVIGMVMYAIKNGIYRIA